MEGAEPEVYHVGRWQPPRKKYSGGKAGHPPGLSPRGDVLDSERYICLKMQPFFERRSTRNETHLSAEQAHSQAGPRIPQEDENKRGPNRIESQAPQGTEAPHSSRFGQVNPQGPRERFGRRHRILLETDFARCRAEGHRLSSRSFVLVRRRNEEGASRLGVAVSRKTGGAVIRNRWKRVIREMFRRAPGRFRKSEDHLVIVRHHVHGTPTPEARRELENLFARAGVR